jgi:hypothetical protein
MKPESQAEMTWPRSILSEVTAGWNVYSDIATQGTTLVETTTMPESQFTITQGTLTIN